MATLNYVGDGKEAKTLEVSDKAARQIQYAINNSKQMVTFPLTKKTDPCSQRDYERRLGRI